MAKSSSSKGGDSKPPENASLGAPARSAGAASQPEAAVVDESDAGAVATPTVESAAAVAPESVAEPVVDASGDSVAAAPAAVVADGAVAADAVPAVAAADAPPAAAPPPPPSAPPGASAPPASSAPPPPPGPPPGPSPASVAFNKFVAGLRSHFDTAEILALGGSLLILAVFILFGVVINNFYPNDATVVLAAGLALVVCLQRLGLWSFGSGYQTAVLILGALLGVLLIDTVLVTLRGNRLTGVPAGYLLGLLLTWVGMALAAVSAYLVWVHRRR
jgi:hypothetical protein